VFIPSFRKLLRHSCRGQSILRKQPDPGGIEEVKEKGTGAKAKDINADTLVVYRDVRVVIHGAGSKDRGERVRGSWLTRSKPVVTMRINSTQLFSHL
jgi:hypothetical protein